MSSNSQPTGTRPYLRSLLVAAFGLGLVMFWIVPKLKPALEASSVAPPPMIVAIIHVSDWVVNYFYLIPFILFALWLMIEFVKKNKTGEYALERISRTIPLLRKYSPS